MISELRSIVDLIFALAAVLVGLSVYLAAAWIVIYIRNLIKYRRDVAVLPRNIKWIAYLPLPIICLIVLWYSGLLDSWKFATQGILSLIGPARSICLLMFFYISIVTLRKKHLVNHKVFYQEIVNITKIVFIILLSVFVIASSIEPILGLYYKGENNALES